MLYCNSIAPRVSGYNYDAMLLAGYGKRLSPLTLKTPKPMLKVAGKPLLQHHIERLVASGINDLVINTSWLAEQIEDYFGDGSKFGVNISWSRESQPLETGGGIANAQDLLGQQPFLLINGDIWTDFPLHLVSADKVSDDKVAWLLMVNNPQHNPSGDFALVDDLVTYTSTPKFTFSGISILCPQVLDDYIRSNRLSVLSLYVTYCVPLLKIRRVVGTVYKGKCDVGTLERYQELNNSLNKHTR